MIEFAIVMMFWDTHGDMRMQTRRGFPSEEHCAASLTHDTQEFIKLFGNARGYCISSPDKPAGLPEPKQKINTKDA